MTEAEFQAGVLALAGRLSLVVLHVRDPRREDSTWKGFPDLVIIAPAGGILFRELKMPGKELRAAQRDWAQILSGQDFGVWKPADLHTGRVRAELEQLARIGPPGDRDTAGSGGPLTAQERLWLALTAAAGRESHA